MNAFMRAYIHRVLLGWAFLHIPAWKPVAAETAAYRSNFHLFTQTAETTGCPPNVDQAPAAELNCQAGEVDSEDVHVQHMNSSWPGSRRSGYERPASFAGNLHDSDVNFTLANKNVCASPDAHSLSALAETISHIDDNQVVKRSWRKIIAICERIRHMRREIRMLFSSELERCLLKATRPDSKVVDDGCIAALLNQARRLPAVEACCDCDPQGVICSKLYKKMMEADWRTIAKAMCVLHNLERDSPPKEAARFSAFMKEKWSEGASELGRHVRTVGGTYAPWLKVYCGYLASRGRRLETAMHAFESWESLTSTRQLRNALAETNTLLARALALHFAVDASAGSAGGNILRKCCALAFQDVVEVLTTIHDTGCPPALLGVPGVSAETGEIDWSGGTGLASSKEVAAGSGMDGSRRDLTDDDGVAAHRDTATPGRPDGPGEIVSTKSAADTSVLAEAVCDLSGDILEAAGECIALEDVSGVITAVYSTRYGSGGNEGTCSLPTWIKQLADLSRLATSGRKAAMTEVGTDDDGTEVISPSSVQVGRPTRPENHLSLPVDGEPTHCENEHIAGGHRLEARGGGDVAERQNAPLRPLTSTSLQCRQTVPRKTLHLRGGAARMEWLPYLAFRRHDKSCNPQQRPPPRTHVKSLATSAAFGTSGSNVETC